MELNAFLGTIPKATKHHFLGGGEGVLSKSETIMY
jgi:hypothetical protein